MMHDNTLERTTTGTGKVNDYTYDQLQQLYLKDTEARVTAFKIPTLGEVLEWSRGKVILNLDVKRTVPMQMVVDAVRAHQAEPYTVVITYNANQAKELADIAPELMISVSAKGKEDLERIEKLGVKVENLTAFVGVSEPSKEVYEYLHSRGIICILGTMGNLDRSAATRGDQLYQQLIQNGADILSTDRNQEASKVLLGLVRK